MVRDGSKKAIVPELIRRDTGASLQELSCPRLRLGQPRQEDGHHSRFLQAESGDRAYRA
jgi:hypothetical protein